MENEKEISVELKLAMDAVQSFEKEMNSKLYPFECTQERKDFVLLTVLETLKWKGREAIAVAKLYEQLSKAEVKKDGDNSYMFLTGTEVHALNFVLDKYETTGVKSAQSFAEVMRSIMKSLQLVMVDKNQLEELQSKAASAQLGIQREEDIETPEPEVKVETKLKKKVNA